MFEHKGTREICTARLILRRFRAGDHDAMYQNYTSDPAVARYVTWQKHESPAVTEAYLSTVLAHYESADAYRWAIEYAGELIGAIDAVKVDTANESCEIGYCMGSKWWGKGIMTEALRGVIGYLFTVPQFYCVHAYHHDQNPASGRVMEKAGMLFEGSLRARRKEKDGTFHALKHYSILHDEFMEAQS
ncbi:MAG: GNAT family N-acetyltransferase [Christensenellales bacterium]|jgi:ribosomal-protein-alanine N-acetyltransferase